jgi:lysozyme
MQDGTITRAEADDYFEFELNEKAEGVEELLDVEVTQGQFDALVSFAYNVGTGALRKSTLLRLLNEGRHWEAGNQFPRWNRGGGRVLAGLTRRRRSEQRLYMGLPFELAYVTNQEFNQLYK